MREEQIALARNFAEEAFVARDWGHKALLAEWRTAWEAGPGRVSKSALLLHG